FFSSRRRHTRWPRDWSSDVCSSDLAAANPQALVVANLANKSGPADIAVANAGTNNVTIFLNNGQGQFGAGTSYDAGTNPVGIVRSEERRVGKECRSRWWGRE